jgi:hypothetical protein
MAIQKIKAVCLPEVHHDQVSFECVPDMAQYKGSDYANAVRVERGISLEEAKEIAAMDSSIDYFVYLKGGSMVLEFVPGQEYDSAKDPLHLVTEGNYIFDDGEPGHGYMRTFRHGDVVFFKNEGKWLGTAPDLADVYLVKRV